ncbi:transcriptional regulator [Corynebacterium liangguodongii]|uniref:MarR family transcriptional regulator n=1 Tax=Corynebacterium liangguodongii TaxID=2079535 RepID=A0A2S0WFN7_9CORY|nr:transcriptional regulator [Corynebacterium liangguodongii]AWB84560.1 MarR family transcriptional regulator [Corynebacterium liangguodongii]PWB98856.1 MarR family transcriptional regulator [Corynebacterium liangguodongii]
MPLDTVIHPINRLKICAALSAGGATEGELRYEMRFSRLRELTKLSDATLSKQLTALEEHGYITRFREYGSTRAKDTVWVTLTKKGKEAFDSHVAALREIAGEVPPP